jgi:hypothetical protein
VICKCGEALSRDSRFACERQLQQSTGYGDIGAVPVWNFATRPLTFGTIWWGERHFASIGLDAVILKLEAWVFVSGLATHVLQLRA